MLKDYLKTKGISVYELSKGSGIAYSTLNDFVNGKVAVDNCKVSLLRSLSNALDMSMDALYDMCSENSLRILNAYNADASLRVRAKYYHAQLSYDGEPVDIRLCKVTEDNSFYIEDIARWRVEAYIRERRMREFV